MLLFAFVLLTFAQLSISQNKPCEKVGLTCLDCNTLQQCKNAGDAKPVYTISCETQTNGLYKYCDEKSNQCVEQDSCSGGEIPTYECYRTGRRPNPKDCHQYIECIKNPDGKYVGYHSNCPGKQTYCPKSETCVASGCTCTEIKAYCRTKSGKMIAYPPYPSIYALCPTNASDDVSVIQICKGEYEFVENVGQCQPVCRQNGYIASNTNCHQYYICSNGQLSLNTCPNGYGFNSTTKLCDSNAAQCTDNGFGAILDRDERSAEISDIYEYLQALK